MSDLKWGNITICDATTGTTSGAVTLKDNYVVTQVGASDAEWRDVVFPNTAGREMKRVGTKQTDATSRVVVIGSTGNRRAIIYKSSFSNLISHIQAIEAARLSPTTAIASLVTYAGTFTNMKLASISFSEPITFNAGIVGVTFTATFVEYA